MRLLAPLLAYCLLSASLIPSQGAEPPSSSRITFNARDLRLERVISQFERLAHVNFVLDAQLADVPITVSIKGLPADEAVRALIDAAQRQVPDLLVDEKAGVYRLQLKPGGKIPPRRNPRPDVGSARKISVALGNIPLPEALELIYRQPGVPAGKAPVQVEKDVPDQIVNLIFSDDAEPALLRLAVRQAATRVRDLRLEEKEGRYVVGIRPTAQREPPPLFRGKQPPPDPASRRIVLAFRNAPLRYVLRSVLDSVLPAFGPSPEYEVGMDVPDTLVSFTLVTASPEQALTTTLAEIKKQVRGLTIQPEEGKLRFSGPRL